MLHKNFFLVLIALLFSFSSFSQILFTIADGGNKKASVTERIGITDVTIHYDRPAVKGREGKIWGQLVPYGFTDLGFGTSKAAPWRAGANENTTISFSNDVMVEGKPLRVKIAGRPDGISSAKLESDALQQSNAATRAERDRMRAAAESLALEKNTTPK